MKTKFILILMAVMISGSLFAQSPKAKAEQTPQQAAEKLTAKLKSSLLLTPAQEKKVYEINLNYATKLIELRKKQAELREKQNAELEALYTPEQKAKIKEMENKKEKRAMETKREGEKNGVQQITIRQ